MNFQAFEQRARHSNSLSLSSVELQPTFPKPVGHDKSCICADQLGLGVLDTKPVPKKWMKLFCGRASSKQASGLAFFGNSCPLVWSPESGLGYWVESPHGYNEE